MSTIDWNVKNAISRDVERQQLNKILKDIKERIDSIYSSSEGTGDFGGEQVRIIVGEMVNNNYESGLSVIFNPDTGTLDFQTNDFTINLTGDITGSGNVVGLGGATIVTTLDPSLVGVTEAPDDGDPYWRRWGGWERVAAGLEQLDDVTTTGFMVKIYDLVEADNTWVSRQIDVVAGELVVTNANGELGNPTLGLADVLPTAGGTLQKTAFDSKGRRVQEDTATTDDLPEGTTNLYFPEAPIDGQQYVRQDGAWAVVEISQVLDYIPNPPSDSNADLYDTIVALLADMQAKGLMEGPPPVPMGITATYPNATVGVAYSYTPTLTGDYVTPVVFSIQSGAIPAGPGWSFNTATGELSNPSPVDEEVANFTVRATDGTTPTAQTADTSPQTVNVTAGVSTGFFGTQNTGGMGNWGTNADRAMLCRWTMSDTGTAQDITLGFLPSQGSGGATSVKGLIYAADGPGGSAGTLVAVGSIVSVPQDYAGGQIVSTFSGEALAPGEYWIGGVANNFTANFDSGETVTAGYCTLYQPLSYASPPADLSGTAATGSYANSLAAYVTYQL